MCALEKGALSFCSAEKPYQYADCCNRDAPPPPARQYRKYADWSSQKEWLPHGLEPTALWRFRSLMFNRVQTQHLSEACIHRRFTDRPAPESQGRKEAGNERKVAGVGFFPSIKSCCLQLKILFFRTQRNHPAVLKNVSNRWLFVMIDIFLLQNI